MPAFQDLTGHRYGRLTVLAHAGARNHKTTQWLSLCDCGEHCTTPAIQLRKGLTRSCGCLRREVSADRARKLATKHGHAAPSNGNPTKTYNSWQAMRQRCTSPKGKEVTLYAGVTVCARWADSFENFLADMGERPAGTTLDRWPNPAGSYEPSNCRWGTYSEQRTNQRRCLPQFNVEDLA